MIATKCGFIHGSPILKTSIPFPPELLQWMGYNGKVNLVGLYFTVNDVRLTDGLIEFNAVHHPWKQYYDSPVMWPQFEWLRSNGYSYYCYEDAESPWPEFGFLLDRSSLTISVVTLSELQKILENETRFQIATNSDWARTAIAAQQLFEGWDGKDTTVIEQSFTLLNPTSNLYCFDSSAYCQLDSWLSHQEKEKSWV